MNQPIVGVESKPSYPSPDFYAEIKSGVWAVGLTAVVLWIATRGLRLAIAQALTKLVDAHIASLDTLKETSNKTLEEVEDIHKIVRELSDKWE